MGRTMCFCSVISYRVVHIYTPEVQRTSHPTILISIWCWIFFLLLLGISNNFYGCFPSSRSVSSLFSALIWLNNATKVNLLEYRIGTSYHLWSTPCLLLGVHFLIHSINSTKLGTQDKEGKEMRSFLSRNSNIQVLKRSMTLRTTKRE